MVWACPSQPCSNKVSGWRAFTCHVPGRATAASMTSEPKALSSTPQHTATDTHCTQQESTMVVADSWGATDDTWGSSQTDHDTDFQGKDAFDFSDLDCALTNASQHVPENSHKQHNRPTSKSMQRQHQHQGQHASSCCLTSDVAQPSLPGFYLHMTAEASGGSSSLSAEDQHIADLVAAYQDETQQVLYVWTT